MFVRFLSLVELLQTSLRTAQILPQGCFVCAQSRLLDRLQILEHQRLGFGAFGALDCGGFGVDFCGFCRFAQISDSCASRGVGILQILRGNIQISVDRLYDLLLILGRSVLLL